jgi:hypothetical protein
MGYFASRSAAMGPVSAEVVIATFYNFHPQMVKRSIPDAWKFSSPERVLEARLRVADSGLRTGLGTLVTAEMIGETAQLAWRAVEAATVEGRPLFGAHLSLDRPSEPHLSLWLAATCLREHRGDGHVACLVTNGVSGLEANVLMEAAGVIPGDLQRDFRGWSVDEWTQAVEALRSRGLLEGDALSNEGAALRDRIEERTDELALQPWIDAGEDVYWTFVDNMKSLVANILDSDALPFPNPMGLTRPPLPAPLKGQ